MCYRIFLAVLLVLLPGWVAASGQTRVEALVMPVWLERGKVVRPLVSRDVLRAGDLVRTGPNARVLLRLPDETRVKLGESASFRLNESRLAAAPVDALDKPVQGKVFSATMAILRGAFRLTSVPLERISRRQVLIHVGNLTAGIRGTDIWGKSSEDDSLLCLIEGRVDVQDSKKLFSMLDPMTVYVSRTDGSSDPVSPVDPEKLKAWALETEIVAGQGAVRQQGGWQVILASPNKIREAEQLRSRLTKDGFAAEIVVSQVRRKKHYRVLISRLADKQEARALAQRLGKKYSGETPWVSRDDG